VTVCSATSKVKLIIYRRTESHDGSENHDRIGGLEASVREAMPTSESFSFREADRLVLDPAMSDYDFSSELDLYGSTDSISQMKDGSFMEFQAGDTLGSTAFDGPVGFGRNTQQLSKAIPAADTTNYCLPLHRGSTSSSSSLRSTGSNSPPTIYSTMDATAMENSPGDWKFGDNFTIDPMDPMDPANDMSQYLDLSSNSSSPCAPVSNEPSLEYHTSGETLPQGRAVKRRKAPQKRRTVSFA
jgi:hypothetical protein